ncbi:hypothetical protein [Actinoplanes sp. URMC 104]|uniref:hypothetical protein n=1 Tax=Actinoplanes sp. URMC 104 TaxID=3423409 RepID=UPI003F1BB057
MRAVRHFHWSGALLLIVVPVVINLLTALVNIDWYRKWWWVLVAILVAAALPSLYLRRGQRTIAVRRVAAVSDRAGTLYLFVVTTAGEVLRRQLREEGAWSDWEDHGFTFGRAADVAAAVPGHGRLETFVADSKGTLWTRRRDRDGWTAWAPVEISQDVRAVAALDAMSGWPGHREVFVVSEQGRLFHRWQWDGEPWSQWYPADRAGCRDVALSVPSPGVLECFVVNRDGETWHRWFVKEAWHSWHTLDRPETRSPSVAISALNSKEGHQEIYVVGSAGDVAHRWHFQRRPWEQWYPIPAAGEQLEDIAASATSRGRYEIIGVGQSGALWRRSYRAKGDGWSSWQPIPQ